MVLPLGEQMSAHLFVACLSELGAKGAFVDSARVLATDEKFGDATPDMEPPVASATRLSNPSCGGPDPGRHGLQRRHPDRPSHDSRPRRFRLFWDNPGRGHGRARGLDLDGRGMAS